jgi:hypothetical protein
MKRIFFVLSLLISIQTFAQELISDNSLLNDAFKLAVQTVDINTRRGILAAGGDYGGEWTRDIAINSWNGVSLLRPKVAEKSLWSVTVNKDTIGHQYWDKIIWAIAACNHYIVTGDKEFLAQSYKCSANTIKKLEQTTYDTSYGLFMGPSVFNDGIAAYPEPIYEPNNYSGGVLDHKNSYNIKCLSTNCIYYGAYIALCKMSGFLNENSDITKAYRQKAETLKSNILKNFYNSDKNIFNYLIDQNGKVDNSQEALGLSFAIMFGIINGEKANQLIENAVVSKYGITSITPDFPRYSADKPGRHNNIIWPMVNGFFAKAAIVAQNYKSFGNELNSLTHLALDEDKGNYNFREIYNPYSGKPDGGYQAWGEERPNYHWESCRSQTWSATAYISMVIDGLCGLKFNEQSISFTPFLPDEISFLELKGLVYRGSKLNISIKGKGNTIKSFLLDGTQQTGNSISSTINGEHNIVIVLK